MRALPSLLVLLLSACQANGDDSVDLGPPVDPLVLPDVSGVDFAGAFSDALTLAKTVHAGRVWDGHIAALAGAREGCPDFYAGAPDSSGVEGDTVGASWYDQCTTSGGVGYRGVEYWEGDVAVAGDPATPDGETTDATRLLTGDGVVDGGASGGLDFEFSGTATDALNRTDAKGYQHWTWSSTVTGTATGTDMFGSDPLAPGGWRTDLALSAVGGDVQALSLAGNVYLFDHLLQDRFDSVELDVEYLGAGAAGPDDCALEPRGWMGVRDEDAYWYDVVFLPRYADPNDTGSGDPGLSACDGCGTVYIRGVQADAVGQVCLDADAVWTQDPVTPPDATDFVLSLHVLASEVP